MLASNTSYPNFSDLRQGSDSFTAFAAATPDRPTLTGLGEPQRLWGEWVSEDFFAVAGVEPVHGRTFRPEDFAISDRAVLS